MKDRHQIHGNAWLGQSQCGSQYPRVRRIRCPENQNGTQCQLFALNSARAFLSGAQTNEDMVTAFPSFRDSDGRERRLQGGDNHDPSW